MKHIIIIIAILTTITFNLVAQTANNENLNTKDISAGCIAPVASAELNINNVRALIYSGGDMWWDLQGSPKYEVPKGTGKHSCFAGTIWIGGTDINGQLRLAAQKYRSNGVDYWTGPLVESGTGIGTTELSTCNLYDELFVIQKQEVETFRNWFNADQATRDLFYPDYEVPEIIQDWPAHGDFSNGYSEYLAPFYDTDADGLYNPDNGDYPFYDLDGILPCGTTADNYTPHLMGDQTIWWVYNDNGNVHTETGGEAIGIEIQAQAFAFSTNDELNNCTFYNYRIINRGTYSLENTYFGIWTDADIGEQTDDYIGCDVSLGLGYIYNGDEMDGDGNGKTYGSQPPALGIDMFEGPYQDPDGLDNLSAWNSTGLLDCENGYGYRNAAGDPDPSGTYLLVENLNVNEGSINGLNFGDGIVDNERWGMRRFIYFNNDGSPMGDPTTAEQYYYYLRGYWRDGTRMQYGGNGYQTGGVEADFMFPGDPVSDPCGWGTSGAIQSGWSEESENNTPGDRRLVQSAGPFTFEPGEVNYVTTGVVWARAFTGGAIASVEEVKRADEKAQKLFDNCFKTIDGPDAPELSFIELDQEIICQLWNEPQSNNYLEGYYRADNSIICPDGPCDKYFRFQGYQVYQLKDPAVTSDYLLDNDYARLAFQCDVADGIDQVINFIWSPQISMSIPTEMVNGADDGIQHTFRITRDLFAEDNDSLVNGKTYYYMAIAYAHNQFKEYLPVDPTSWDGQRYPYLPSKKSVSGPVKYWSAIPDVPVNDSSYTMDHGGYGQGVPITRMEGLGVGHNYLKISDATHDEIMSGPPWKSNTQQYQAGYGPVEIKIVDPLNVIEDDYVFRLSKCNQTLVNGFIKDADWFVYKASEEDQLVKDDNECSGFSSYPQSTVFSDSTILFDNEQLILDWGISIRFVQTDVPIMKQYLSIIMNNEILNFFIKDNGFVGASIEFEDPQSEWLSGMEDKDIANAEDWIRSGTRGDENNWQYDDDRYNGKWSDEYENYESILGGIWAPYRLCSYDRTGSNPRQYGVGYSSSIPTINLTVQRIASIDLYITKDKTKWTRCPVIETCENDTLADGTPIPGPSEGSAWKFDLRNAPSIDKDGNFATDTSTSSTNPDDANYIFGKGLGWFPGYAIDVETGERLNMAYGESSNMISENGRDMLWNPNGSLFDTLQEPIMGGKHFIYIMGHNLDKTKNEYMPAYDAGLYIADMLSDSPTLDYGCAGLTSYNLRKNYVFRNAMWASVPLLKDGYTINSYDDIPCNVKIELRVANSYWKGIYEYTVPDTVINGTEYPLNYNYPMFSFSTVGYAPTLGEYYDTTGSGINVMEMAEDNGIGLYPNPFNLSSKSNQLVRITGLPKECSVSIFNINGTYIGKLDKNDKNSYIDFDLLNMHGALINKGIYIIKIDCQGGVSKSAKLIVI